MPVEGWEDAITSCPIERASKPGCRRQSFQGDATNHKSLSWPVNWATLPGTPAIEDQGDEGSYTEILWQQMLAVQREFGCYNSARLTAALDPRAEMATRRLFHSLKSSPGLSNLFDSIPLLTLIP